MENRVTAVSDYYKASENLSRTHYEVTTIEGVVFVYYSELEAHTNFSEIIMKQVNAFVTKKVKDLEEEESKKERPIKVKFVFENVDLDSVSPMLLEGTEPNIYIIEYDATDIYRTEKKEEFYNELGRIFSNAENIVLRPR